MRSLILSLTMAALLPAQPEQVQAALTAGSYFPLEVGDRWVYRIDSRTDSAVYQTWTVERTEERDGRTYSVIAIRSKGALLAESFFRTDGRGRVFVLTGQGDQLFLDTVDSSDAAQLKIQSRGGSYRAPIGSFADTLTYRNQINTLTLESGTLGRGVGLLASTTQLIAGSSGGFTEGRTLVEASIGGRLQFGLPAAGVQLAVESLSLDLTGKQADNCAVPCYFVACGFFSATDPPGTYKPCARARVALTNWPADASHTVHLQLFSPDGNVVIDQKVDAGDGPAFTQLRLYSQPNEPLAPGSYRLVASTEDGAAQSSLVLALR